MNTVLTFAPATVEGICGMRLDKVLEDDTGVDELTTSGVLWKEEQWRPLLDTAGVVVHIRTEEKAGPVERQSGSARGWMVSGIILSRVSGSATALI